MSVIGVKQEVMVHTLTAIANGRCHERIDKTAVHGLFGGLKNAFQEEIGFLDFVLYIHQPWVPPVNFSV
jgi:hypothetical protein